MAAKNTIDLLIKVTDKASKEIKKTETGLDDLSDVVNKLKGALGVAAVTGVAKTVFELSKLGAESVRTRNSFEAISGGAIAATANLEAMQQATDGAISRQEAMQAANLLMQTGLADNAMELETVATMAVRLGTAMGVDATQSMEKFTMLLANQSIEVLDTFGISGGAVRKRIIELQEANTGMTRETAFMTATMEQGEIAMDRLGESTRDDKQAFEGLDAAMADLKATIGESLAPATADVVRLITTLVSALDKAEAATGFLKTAYDVVNPAQTLYRALTKDATEATEDLIDAEGDLADETVDVSVSMESLAADSALVERATRDLTDEMEDEKEALEDAKQAMSDLSTVMKGDVSRANDDFLDEQGDLEGKIEDTKASIERLEREFANGVISLNDFATGSDDLRGKLGELETAYGENAAAHEAATARILFGMVEQKLAIDGLTTDEIGFLEDLAGAWGLIDQPTLRALQRTGELTGAFQDGKISREEYLEGLDNLKDAMLDDTTPATEDLTTKSGDLDEELTTGLIDDSLPKAKQGFEEMMGAAHDTSTELQDGLIDDTLPESQEALEETTEAAEDTTEALEDIPTEILVEVDIVGHLPVIAAAENVKQALDGIPRHVQVTISASVDPLLTPGSPSPLELSIRGIVDALHEMEEAGRALEDFGSAFGGLGGAAFDFIEEGSIDPLESAVEGLIERQEDSADALRDIEQDRNSLLHEAQNIIAAQNSALQAYENTQQGILNIEQSLLDIESERTKIADEQRRLGDIMAALRQAEADAETEILGLRQDEAGAESEILSLIERKNELRALGAADSEKATQNLIELKEELKELRQNQAGDMVIALASQEKAAERLAKAQENLADNTDLDRELELRAAIVRAQRSLADATGSIAQLESAESELLSQIDSAKERVTLAEEYEQVLGQITEQEASQLVIQGQIAEIEEARTVAQDAYQQAQEQALENDRRVIDLRREEEGLLRDRQTLENDLVRIQNEQEMSRRRLLVIDDELLGLERQRRQEAEEYQRIQDMLIVNQEELNRLKSIELEFERAKAELDYLAQQQKLLDTISEFDLDMDSILQGVTLGLGARPEDVLQAMIRAMEAAALVQQEAMADAYPGYVWPYGSSPGDNPANTAPPSTSTTYNLIINTSAPIENIIDDFEMMRAAAGG